jgi:predicted transcriptional regulator
VIPRLRDVPYDRQLRGVPTVVYLHLLNELDPVEYRDVKQLALGRRLELSERAVRKALRVLERKRFIERGTSEPGGSHRYRLIYSRMP